MATVALLIWFESTSQVKEEWVRRLNGPVNGNDGAAALVVDDSGNVYITGSIQTKPDTSACATIKYDTKGIQQWIALYQHPGDYVGNDGRKVLLDKHGNVYILGYAHTESDEFADYFSLLLVIKYNSSGIQQWVQTVDRTIYSTPVDMVLDDAGNVYVTEYENDFSGDYFFITARFNTNGVQQWLQVYESPDLTVRDIPTKISVDKQENIYVGGYTEAGYSIIKYDAVGAQQWVRSYRDSVNLWMMDDELNLYTVANLHFSELIFMKFNKDGELQWKTNKPGFLQLTGMTIDHSANAYAICRDTFDMLNIIKIKSDGIILWHKTFADPLKKQLLGKDIIVDRSGNSYVLAKSAPDLFTAKLVDILAIKFDNNGNENWFQRYDGPAKNNDIPHAIALDSAGNIYVAGVSDGIETKVDGVVIKYSQTPEQFGVCCFDDGLGSQAKCGSNVTPLNCSKSGKDAFFAGSVNDCSLIDTATLCGKTPLIVHIDAAYIENERSIKVSWERKESSPITGYYVQRSSDGISFKSIGFMPVNAAGNYIFTDPYPEVENYYKLVWFEKNVHESNQVLALAIKKDRMQLLPNPATNKVRIILKNADRFDSRLTVADNTGRMKFSQLIKKGTRSELDVSNLSSGIYFIRIEQNGKVYREKLVKQ